MAKPRYLDLADALAAAIENGSLAPGSRLPTHRTFAEQEGVAVATATHAYRELERRGLVVGERGRGTFVRDPGLPTTLGTEQTAAEGLVDLVFNMPGSESDPEMLRSKLKRLAAAGDLEAMLRYQPHGGRPHERRIIAHDIARTLGPVDPSRLLMTSGGQHGLAITALALLRRGDAVACDALTYPGWKAAAALAGIELVPVPSSADGSMDPAGLDRLCRARTIRAVYTMPTVQNPLGSVAGEDARNALVEAARRRDLLIIEDGAYAFLETTAPPSIVSLAPERCVHVGGFSKSLATGLRLGYVVAPTEHVADLTRAIRATTWNAPALVSALVTGWIEDGTLARCEEERRRDGAARQAILQAALPDVPVLAHPNAGFAWLPLPAGQRAEPIIARLHDAGLSVTGAEPFMTTETVPQALRLAFGGVPLDELTDVLVTVRNAL